MKGERQRDEELAGAIGRLGDTCLRLHAQRDWLTHAVEGFAGALYAVLDEIDGELEPETLRRVRERVRAIVGEHVDTSDETLAELFG